MAKIIKTRKLRNNIMRIHIVIITIIISIFLASCIKEETTPVTETTEQIISHETYQLDAYESYLNIVLANLENEMDYHLQEANNSIIFLKSLLNRSDACLPLNESSEKEKCENIRNNLKFGIYEREIINITISDEELTELIIINTNTTTICEGLNINDSYWECREILEGEISESEKEIIIAKLDGTEVIENVENLDCDSCLTDYSINGCYNQMLCSKDELLKFVEEKDNERTVLNEIFDDKTEKGTSWDLRQDAAIATNDVITFCGEHTECIIPVLIREKISDIDCNKFSSETNIYYCSILKSLNSDNCESLSSDKKEYCLALLNDTPCPKDKPECEDIKYRYYK